MAQVLAQNILTSISRLSLPPEQVLCSQGSIQVSISPTPDQPTSGAISLVTTLVSLAMERLLCSLKQQTTNWLQCKRNTTRALHQTNMAGFQSSPPSSTNTDQNSSYVTLPLLNVSLHCVDASQVDLCGLSLVKIHLTQSTEVRNSSMKIDC